MSIDSNKIAKLLNHLNGVEVANAVVKRSVRSLTSLTFTTYGLGEFVATLKDHLDYVKDIVDQVKDLLDELKD